jgi:hypothetical protein
MCPQQTNDQWLALKKNAQADWERACRIDEEIRGRLPNVYLLSKCIPLRELE